MSILTTLIERARKNPKVIVLPEGQDPRVVAAANKAVEEKVVAKAVVLGSEAEIAEACAKAGIAARNFETIDYLNSGLFNDFAAEFCKMREKKGMTPEKAAATMKSRIYFGAMMCRRGLADGPGGRQHRFDRPICCVPRSTASGPRRESKSRAALRDGPQEPDSVRRRCAAVRGLRREPESECAGARRHRAGHQCDLPFAARAASRRSHSCRSRPGAAPTMRF